MSKEKVNKDIVDFVRNIIEQLQAKVNKQAKRISFLELKADYARHKSNCKPKPWENECKCGYLQIPKGE